MLVRRWLSSLLCAVCLLSIAGPSHAYVEVGMSLGAVIAQSTTIVLVRVERVDKEKNMILYRKVQDIKGKHPTDVIKHNIGRGGFHPREWQYPMEWAEPGKLAVFFHNGGASETCIGNDWYQAYAGGEWWNMSHGEPFLLRTFAGRPEKLAAAVAEVLAGREVVVPCMVDGNKEDLKLRRAKVQRLRVNLKLQDYNPKRDFVGWGGEDFRRIAGMPGFTHSAGLPRVDPEAQAIACADIDGDGKPDLCLIGASRVVLLQNGGESLQEVTLPGVGGCRAAVWADYDGDGKVDLFLATPTGPKLFLNQGGAFKDDSARLPKEPAYNLTAAAWIDYDGDGRPDLLLANGFHGLRLYKNRGKDAAFEDVTSATGLSLESLAKGDSLAVADVNGDGRPDFLHSAGTGMLFVNAGGRFLLAKNSGIEYTSGKVGPVFGDFDGDGAPDLFVPQRGGLCKLLRNDGAGNFVDVTAQTGDLSKPLNEAACAAWGDFDNDGRLDLAIGCLRGPNRIFRNLGSGKFADATEALGLNMHIFNTEAIAWVDVNNDGVLDLIMNNAGQESVVLLGNPAVATKRAPLLLQGAAVGSRFRLLDERGNSLAVFESSGGDGRGGQHAGQPRFALEPGKYRLEIRTSSGKTTTREVVVATSPVRLKIEER